MGSSAPFLTPPATGVGFSPPETTHAPPLLPKSLGMKKTHRVQAPPPTAPMVSGVATASPATAHRTYRRQTGSKADGGGGHEEEDEEGQSGASS
jgi:hypothetical protein